jgi:hypothetical protein
VGVLGLMVARGGSRLEVMMGKVGVVYSADLLSPHYSSLEPIFSATLHRTQFLDFSLTLLSSFQSFLVFLTQAPWIK